MSAPRPRWAGAALAALAVVAVVVGVVLVVTGDDGGGGRTGGTAVPSGASAPDDGRPRATLPLGEGPLTVERVEQLAGFELPDDVADFLTAQLDSRSQLDVTFTIAPDQADAFVAGSGLPSAEDGRRVVAHSSPLWDLNPAGEVRGTAGRHDGVRRAVELVPEEGRVRVRAVVTPA